MTSNMEEGTRKNKRKRSMIYPKLIVGEKVEVRSMEKGFVGSWHSGRVICCNYESRTVQYDYIIYDDDSDQDSEENLVEPIKVTPAIDGSICAVQSPPNYRGYIRPLPPPSDFDLRDLQYGQCVDVYFKDAFWEGVVLDHNRGSDHRLIMFPDIGDEMIVHVDIMRLTQDWEELENEWQPRANWLLLELVEEIRGDLSLHVSLTELWNKVRLEKRFIMHLQEWTSTMKDTWKEVMKEVILNIQSLALKHLFKLLNDSDTDDEEKEISEGYFDDFATDGFVSVENESNTDLAFIEDESKLFSNSLLNPPNPSPLDGNQQHQQQPLVIQDNGWCTAGTDFVPVIKSDPDAVSQYVSSEGVGRRSADLLVRLRQHLASLGWRLEYRLEYRREGGKQMIRMRYTNPQGKAYMSLVTACRSLLQHLPGIGPHSPLPPVSKQLHQSIPLAAVNPITSTDDPVFYKPEYNREAVLEYISMARNKNHDHNWYRSPFVKSVQLKVRMHLSYLGWKFWYTIKKKRELRYRSPRGRMHMSLIEACKQCVKEEDSSAQKSQENAEHDSTRPSSLNTFCTTQEDTSSGRGLGERDSLLQCQSQLKKSKRRASIDKENDSICFVCRMKGILVLCDRCPSSYHISCLGLEDVPDGEWFCPSCCCGCCGRIQFSEDADGLKDDSFFYCDQCQHNYHIECLKERANANPENVPMGNNFCSKRCENICLGLASRVGNCIPVGDKLTWTLWKGVCSTAGPDQELKSCNKLKVALSVMKECFEPFIDPDTGRDLIEDLIFCPRSELNPRLNYEGLFTMILEQNNEPVSVAILRIHGEKFAEMPFIGTGLQYRKKGMCGILMNELEKMLKELGIQSFVLPSMLSEINMWIYKFGFSTMKSSDKLKYKNHTFLYFSGTVMCEKLLFPPTSENMTEVAPEKNVMHLKTNKTILENSEDNHVEENKIMEQISSPHCIPVQDIGPVVPSAELGAHESQFDGFVKFYKRRSKHDNTKCIIDTTRLC